MTVYGFPCWNQLMAQLFERIRTGVQISSFSNEITSFQLLLTKYVRLSVWWNHDLNWKRMLPICQNLAGILLRNLRWYNSSYNFRIFYLDLRKVKYKGYSELEARNAEDYVETDVPEFWRFQIISIIIVLPDFWLWSHI